MAQTNTAVHKKMVEAYQAQDTQDLLQHIAWTDVILPRLKQEREQYQNLLVKSVLTIEPTVKDQNGSIHKISKEQLAGRVAGLDYVIALMAGILSKGEKAIAELRDNGITI